MTTIGSGSSIGRARDVRCRWMAGEGVLMKETSQRRLLPPGFDNGE